VREVRPMSVERTVIVCANADGGESPSALKILAWGFESGIDVHTCLALQTFGVGHS